MPSKIETKCKQKYNEGNTIVNKFSGCAKFYSTQTIRGFVAILILKWAFGYLHKISMLQEDSINNCYIH